MGLDFLWGLHNCPDSDPCCRADLTAEKPAVSTKDISALRTQGRRRKRKMEEEENNICDDVPELFLLWFVCHRPSPAWLPTNSQCLDAHQKIDWVRTVKLKKTQFYERNTSLVSFFCNPIQSLPSKSNARTTIEECEARARQRAAWTIWKHICTKVPKVWKREDILSMHSFHHNVNLSSRNCDWHWRDCGYLLLMRQFHQIYPMGVTSSFCLAGMLISQLGHRQTKRKGKTVQYSLLFPGSMIRREVGSNGLSSCLWKDKLFGLLSL